MKKIVLILIVLTTTLFATKILPIVETEQNKNQWCWSGCSTPILNYYGEAVTQEDIAQYAYGDSTINQWNWMFGNSDVEYQGKIYNPHGIDQILDNWNTPNANSSPTLTEEQWKQEIDDEHPFVIRWGWEDGGGHFVVGMGYLDNGNYQIMNPWFGTGYVVNSYSWIKTAEGGKGDWTHTLTTDREVSNNEEKYKLSVENGEGTGYYIENKIVNISATLDANDTFIKWSGGGLAITDSLSSITTLKMGKDEIIVTAIIEKADMLIYPNGGEKLKSGSTIDIIWNPKSFSDNIKIELQGIVTAGQDKINETLTLSVENSGSYSWKISDTLKTSNWEYKIVITSGSLSDISEFSFSIVEPVSINKSIEIKPSIVLSENGLNLNGFSDGLASVVLYNLSGRVLSKNDIMIKNGSALLSLNKSANGVFVVKVMNNKYQIIKKMRY